MRRHEHEGAFGAFERRDDEGPRPILDQAGEIWAWSRTALRRRRLSIFLLFLLMFAVTALAIWALPPSYTARGQILAHSHVHLPVLANPRRAIPHAADTPTRSVAPMVLSERNLERLIGETDLVERWGRQRSPALKIKDRAMELLLGPISEEDTREALLELLKRNVIVYSDDEVVNFRVTWYDPDTPVLLVEHLQDILLQERRVRENGVISDALEILQDHGSEIREEIDRKLEELRGLRSELGADAPRPRRDPAPRRAVVQTSRSRADSYAIADLRSELDHARRTHREIESQRQRRLVDVQSTFRQRSVDLGPEHPDIIALESQVDALRQVSSEEEILRRRIDNLQSDYLRRGGSADQLHDTSPRAIARQRLADVFDELESVADEEDEALAYARAQLGLTIAKYEDILERISGARIELDTANAAFKYRYTVIGEPRRPRESDGLPTAIILAGGLLLGLVVGVFVGVGREIVGGRLLEGWQIPRFVGLPLLGEVGAERR